MSMDENKFAVYTTPGNATIQVSYDNVISFNQFVRAYEYYLELFKRNLDKK